MENKYYLNLLDNYIRKTIDDISINYRNKDEALILIRGYMACVKQITNINDNYFINILCELKEIVEKIN